MNALTESEIIPLAIFTVIVLFCVLVFLIDVALGSGDQP